MTQTRFGLKYWSVPSPAYIKWLCYFIVGFVVYLLMNLDSSPIESVKLKLWLEWSAPFTVPALIALRDMFGKKTLNDNAKDSE